MVIANASARMATNAGPFDLMTNPPLTEHYSSETFKVQGESPLVLLLAQAKKPLKGGLFEASKRCRHLHYHCTSRVPAPVELIDLERTSGIDFQRSSPV